MTIDSGIEGSSQAPRRPLPHTEKPQAKPRIVFPSGTGRAEFGRPAVTEENITKARDRRQYAQQYFNDLRESRRVTLLALKALDTVAALAPTPPGKVAERAAGITAQSRQRAQLPPVEGPRTKDPAQAQRQHTHPAQHGPVVRPS